MKPGKWLIVTVGVCVLAFASLYSFAHREASSAATAALNLGPVAIEERAAALSPAALRYRLDPSGSKFMAYAGRSGLLWFKGHGHHLAVRDFGGEAVLDPDSLANSSLLITAKAASIEETGEVFTPQQKEIINKELREIVLHPDQYPDIVFRSTEVRGKSTGTGQYELKIAGNLTLHGTTRPVTIPTNVTVSGNQMRSQGEFSISRGDFKVKATSAFHGLVRVRDKVKFEFDIVGHR